MLIKIMSESQRFNWIQDQFQKMVRQQSQEIPTDIKDGTYVCSGGIL
jgi:hypothetical protein